MLIIWRRMGWLVPVIVLISLVITTIAIRATLGDVDVSAHWQNFATFLLASLTIGILGYHLNYRKRTVVINEETGEEEKSPSHTFFFIPMQFWAIILPIFFVWITNDAIKRENQTTAYLNAPIVNDMYLTDSNAEEPDGKDQYSVNIFKVTAVEDTQVHVVHGRYVYDTEYDARSDIRKGNVDGNDDFGTKPTIYSITQLISMKDKGTLLSVYRGEKVGEIGENGDELLNN